jgi:hypothetical protein
VLENKKDVSNMTGSERAVYLCKMSFRRNPFQTSAVLDNKKDASSMTVCMCVLNGILKESFFNPVWRLKTKKMFPT